ncbi:MAG: hypothetical protein VR73_03025 [Gammaproteobacteria bacterium BRH_c0]|nr:MAG: hypothetical protein VR73_03025 [Gammaproteobacteria bacterium BRH_c0]
MKTEFSDPVTAGLTRLQKGSLKLYITGAGGIGKTTLSNSLSDRWALHVINEQFDANIDRGNKKKTAGECRDEILGIYRTKLAEEEQNTRFITDRGPLDLLHLWLHLQLHNYLSKKETTDFLSLAVKQLRSYDFVVILPWNSFPLEQVDQDRAKLVKRNMNPFSQMKHHVSLMGLVHMFCNKHKIIEVPRKIVALEDRIIYLERVVNKRLELMKSDS